MTNATPRSTGATPIAELDAANTASKCTTRQADARGPRLSATYAGNTLKWSKAAMSCAWTSEHISQALSRKGGKEVGGLIRQSGGRDTEVASSAATDSEPSGQEG